MKKLILFIPVLFLMSCGNSGKDDLSLEALGGRVYGGKLRLNETDGLISMYPYLVNDLSSRNIISQIYEGLVRFDTKNIVNVIPSIADSWNIDAKGLVYTFKLKKGVVFHDDPCFPDGKGREVVASDFKYSFTQLCTASEENKLFQSTFQGLVSGADDCYKNSLEGKTINLTGVKVIDEYTLQITLISPASSFIYILAGVSGFVVPHEAVEKYGSKATIGTGAFCYSHASTSEKLLLLKNQNYHRVDSLGNKLPFLDTIEIGFIGDKALEFEAFKKGELDLIFGLPSLSISEMVEAQITDFNSKNPKYYLQRSSEYTTQYYQFNLTRKPFNDVKVRQAFSYAIDREKIISTVLHSEAFGPGICGITAPSISGYDITEIKGYNFSPEKAKKLLAEAGYPNGKNFPPVTLELNSGGGKFENVAEEIRKQLKAVLNVDVSILVVPFAQKLEDAKYGRAEIFRSAWVADYPSPENFLRLFYGVNVPDSLNVPSYPNTSRYKNPVFDSLFMAGLRSAKHEEEYANYMKAEQLLMNDALILVLWYGENLNMSHSFVKNYYFNPMNFKIFSEVYLKKLSSEKP